MNENSKISAALRWTPPIFNVLYKIALLAALIWIGAGLQEIAGALYGSAEACVVDPDAGNSGEENAQPGVSKPFLRGST